MMVVGFTGTQSGMTIAQMDSVYSYLTSLEVPDIDFVHHGDCIGSDETFHRIVEEINDWRAVADNYVAQIFIHIHPPINPSKRAYCCGYESVLHEEKDYIERNHDIVDASDILLATPKGYEEELRSGTWATIRYARKQNVPVVIVWPNGQIG